MWSNAIDGAAYLSGNNTVQFQNINKNYTYQGTTAGYVGTENAEVSNGRFFTKEEETSLVRFGSFWDRASRRIFLARLLIRLGKK